VCTRLTGDSVSDINRARGATSRAAFVRQAIDEKIARETRRK